MAARHRNAVSASESPHRNSRQKRSSLFQGVLLLCAVQVAVHRHPAKGEAGEDELCDHVDLQHDAHGGDLIVAVGQQELVDDDDGQALHQVAQGCRDADTQNLPQLVSTDMALGELDGQAWLFLRSTSREIHHAAQVTDDGCNGGTQCAHTKPGKFRMGLENDVDHGTQNRTNHGFIGKTLTAHQIGMDEAQHDDGDAQRVSTV